jgi:hypothetical protein
LCHQYVAQEQTQEVRLPDGMPDIGTVLFAWGQVIIRGKEWHNGSAGVNGGVMVWVLYLPEDGAQVQKIETWIPFQQNWDFEDGGKDGVLQVVPELRSVDARTLTARKIMVRASIGILGRGTVSEDISVFTPTELPEDVQLLKKSYPMRLPVEAGEKAFQLEQKLPLSDTAVPSEQILRFGISPKISEWKVVSDKLVIRGVANVDALYLGTDGQLHTWDFELPFSQYAQLNQVYEDTVHAQIKFAVTNLELEQDEEGQFDFKAGITGQYTLYDTPILELVEDAYSPRRDVTILRKELQIPAILDSSAAPISAEEKISADMQRIVDVRFYPEHPTVHRQGDQVDVDLAACFQILGYAPDGELQTATVRWGENRTLSARENTGVKMFALPDGKPSVMIGAGEISVTAPLQLQTYVTMGQGMPVITGLELGEIAEPEPTRPSMILRRAGEESLWNIAKSAGSTVQAIQEANGITAELIPDKMLLIPIL